jgi:hypothetical protein
MNITSLNCQLIHEHGQPRCKDVNRGKFLIHPSDLSDILTSRVICYEAGGKGERNDESGLTKCFCSNLEVISDMGPPALLPLRRKAC